MLFKREREVGVKAELKPAGRILIKELVRGFLRDEDAVGLRRRSNSVV
jgi:hypothetical protein